MLFDVELNAVLTVELRKNPEYDYALKFVYSDKKYVM
jgi:hypothetical protein